MGAGGGLQNVYLFYVVCIICNVRLFQVIGIMYWVGHVLDIVANVVCKSFRHIEGFSKDANASVFQEFLNVEFCPVGH